MLLLVVHLKTLNVPFFRKVFRRQNSPNAGKKGGKKYEQFATYLFQTAQAGCREIFTAVEVGKPFAALGSSASNRQSLFPYNPAKCQSQPAVSFIESGLLCLARVSTNVADLGSLFHISWEILFMLQYSSLLTPKWE